MSVIRLYVDEDAMHGALIVGLRARGVDVQTVLDAGLTARDDETQLSFATDEGRAIYSFNVSDFCRLHSQYLQRGDTHAGIIVIPRQRYSVGEQLRQLLLLIERTSAEEMRDTLTFL